MRSTLQVLGFAILALSTAAFAGSLKEGQWEFSNTMKMAGMPDMSELAKKMPPGMKLPGGMSMGGNAGGMTMTMKHCVTAENARPQAKNQDKYKCEMTRQKRDGGHFEWAQHCTGDKTDFTSEGTADYDGDSMTSNWVSKGQMDGHPADMTMSTTGKYLGACPDKK